MHLVGKSGRGHLRRLAHFVALAAHNLFRRLINLRRAVLHICAPVMIQFRSQQTRNFRRPVAQRGGGLLHHLFHGALHRAVRLLLIPLGSLQQRFVSRVLRLGAALLNLFFDLRSSIPHRLLDFRRHFFGFTAQPRHRFLYGLLRSLQRLFAHGIVQPVSVVRRLLHLLDDRVLQLRHALGSLPRLFVELTLRVRRLLFGLLQIGHRALHLIQPWRQFLFELGRSLVQNFLCRSLQRGLNLLHAVRDHLVGLTAHFLVLRRKQLVELLARLA